MKAFTERNPFIIGAAIIAFIMVGTASALLLNGGFFKDQYTIYGDFKDAAGITTQSRVTVAGINVGTVGSIKIVGTQVRVELKVNKGVKLPKDSKAAIKVDTLLGSKAVELTTGSEWSSLLKSGDTIHDTSTPVDLLDVQNLATPLLQQSDTKSLNSLFQQLSDVSEGKNADVQQILQGLDKLSTVIDNRQGQTGELIDSAKTLSQTLAARNQDLVGAVQQLDRIVSLLVNRRTELASLLQSTADATQRLADLIHQNRPELDGVINELHSDLVILSNHQLDLAQSVSLLAAAIKGFASVGYSGAAAYPNRWANIYAQLLGPVDPDALFGACGLIDRALDLALGPDPIGNCAARAGTVPGGVSGQAASSATRAQLGATIPLSSVFTPLVTK